MPDKKTHPLWIILTVIGVCLIGIGLMGSLSKRVTDAEEMATVAVAQNFILAGLALILAGVGAQLTAGSRTGTEGVVFFPPQQGAAPPPHPPQQPALPPQPLGHQQFAPQQFPGQFPEQHFPQQQQPVPGPQPQQQPPPSPMPPAPA